MRLGRWWATLLGVGTTILAGGPRAVGGEDLPAHELEQIRAAAPSTVPATPSKARKLLVYCDCKGFRHSSIPYGAAALRIMGEKTGAYEVLISTDPSVFTAKSLARFDAICFNNTTGELFADPKMKQGLLDFVSGGKGIVGIHAATDCFYEWPEFGALMGGYFAGHPWNEEVGLRIEDETSPLTAMFDGAVFRVADEIYQFKPPFSRDRLRILLSLDPVHSDMNKKRILKTDGEIGVSWIRPYGRGRVFYCSLGHRHEIFWNPQVLKHYLAGIQYALGDLHADATPSSQLKPDGWAEIFNGHDLTGWLAKDGAWAVEDSTLARRGGSYVWTEQEYEDFVLELEFKLVPKANSGIFFRTANIDDPVQTGIELQVLDTYGREDLDKHVCGAVYDCLEPRTNAVKPPGEWNQVRLTCQGPRITAVLNDEPIIDMNLDEWTEPRMNPDGTKNKFKTAYKDMARRGRIGFQDHGKPVWYRNIRIKCLSE